MQSLITLDPSTIKQLDGLYCLNDLHRMAGGKKKDTPSRFLALQKTKALINALENSLDQTTAHNPKKGCEKVFITINGGEYHGAYGCRELVYAYAMWIDAYFYALVLKVFDMVAGNFTSLTDQLNHLTDLSNQTRNIVSHAGYILCVGGKQTKPDFAKLEKTLLNQLQPQLPLDGGNHDSQ